MKKLLLLCVLAVAVGGCSPSEKSIRKAVEKGDYLYVEKYLNNPKYWTDPNKYEINAAALEALILLNRIDSAVNIYKENIEDRLAEGRIVNAFVNGLKKSNLQKMPGKIVELINDDRNNDSDDLLRSVVVELEPSVVATKVKTYIEQAISTRKKGAFNFSENSVKKAAFWDINRTFNESLQGLVHKYSELGKLYVVLDNESIAWDGKIKEIVELKKKIKEDKHFAWKIEKNYEHYRYYEPYNPELDRMSFLKIGAQAMVENGEKRLREASNAVRDLDKLIIEHEAQIATNITDVETAENQLLAKLTDTSSFPIEKNELGTGVSVIQFIAEINKTLIKYGIGFVYDKELSDTIGKTKDEGVKSFTRAYLLRDITRGVGDSESVGYLQYWETETSEEQSISMTGITDRFIGEAKPGIVVNNVVKGMLSDKDFEDFQRKFKIDRVQRGQEFIFKGQEISIRVSGGNLGFSLEIKRDI